MKTSTAQPLSLPVRLTRSLRTPLWRKTVSSILLAQFALWSVQVKGATYDWDPVTGGGTLGGAGTWDATNINWWNGTSDIAWPNLNDTARFGGTAGGVVTLGSAVNAGGLIFNTRGYSIAGGGNALTLSGGATSNIAVNGIGNRTTIDAQISGTSGLTKTGNGVLVLSNNSNNFTGNVLVNQGGLVVTDEAQLGGANLISVNGNSGVNFTGGSLILQGGLSSLSFSKNLSLSGRALNYANSSSAALVNIGANNTISSNIAFSNAAATSIASSYGKLTLSGTIGLPTGNSPSFIGNGNYIISGLVTGANVSTDRFVKSGTNLGTTLWLQNNSNNFVGDIRIDSGTIRVSSSAALGLSTSTTQIDLNNGALEINTDAPDFSSRTVRVRDNTTGTIFVNRALGGSGLNQTVAFGVTSAANTNTTFTINGRDGYNTTFGNGVANFGSGGANNATINNATNGLFTISAPNVWNQTDATARTLTIQGAGDSVVTGNILATGGGTNGSGHILTKGGSGSLTLNATASTFAGSANVTAGTLNISTIGALNATSTGRVVFGGGTLNYTGSGETWTNKVLLLNATNNILTNNGSGALVLPQNVGNNATGTKTLVLGGVNSGVNNITGIIVGTNLGAGVTKIGSGTWQITAPGTAAAQIGTANASYAITGITASTNGTQTITTTNTSGLVVGQPVSGAGVAFGTVISQIISPTQFAVSQAVATTGLGNVGTSVNIGTVTGSTSALNVTANTANLLTVTSTANLVPGQYISGVGLNAADGWYISQINSGTTFTVANSTNTANLANSAAIGAQAPLLSPNYGGATTISNGTLRLNATASGTGSDVVNNGSALTFNTDPITGNGSAGGTLEYRGFTGGSSETLGRLTATAGNATVRITPVDGTNVLTFGSIAAPAVGSSLNFDVPGSPGTNSIVISKGTTAGLLNAHAYYNGSEFAYSPVGPNATLRAPVYGTDAGFTAVNTLTAATNVAINANASSAALAVTSLKVSGNTSLSLTGALTVGGATGGGILVDGATTGATISGTGVTTNSAGDLVIRVNGANDILTLSAPVTASTTGGITKNGAGNLILSGTNAETGTVTINEGKITLSGTGTLGSNNVNLTLRQNTTLDVNGVTTVNAANFQGAGTVTNSAASGSTTLVIGNNNGSQGYFSGTLQDGATSKIALTKTGTGNIAIGGAQNYSGSVNLNGGALLVTSLANIGQASGLGKGDATSTATNQSSLVFNGGTLIYTGANTSGGTAPLNVNIFQQTQTPSVSIDRLFTLAGSGTIDSSGSFGANTLARSANNAALIFNNAGAVAFSGAGTRSLTLQGDSTGDNEFRPIIANNTNAGELTSVTKAGGGLWHLTGANTYTGQTIINGGALQATEGVGIPTNSAISYANTGGGVFQSNGTSPVTINRALGTTGNTIGWTANGSGGFSAGSTPLTVSIAGNPTWGSTANFLGTGNLILNSSTAFADVTLNSDFGIAAGVAAAVNATTTAGSATVNLTSGSTAGLTPGQIISGNANIPAGSFITAINSNTQFTISSGTGVTAATGVATSVATGGFRQIQVNDNSNTGLDYASVTGVISGTGGLATSGGGILVLGAANTYSGGSYINNGAVVVQSIGTGGASSSLGNATGALNIGLLGTGGIVNYVGAGETTTRAVNLAGTTGGAVISSEGSGPLVLTSVANTGAGAKTLTLRGLNLDANAITANLNDNGGALTVTKDNGGIWELSGTNGFTGNLNINGGLLGANGNAALGANGTGNIVFNNGGIYSTNAAGLTITRAVQIAANGHASFTGENAITVSSNIQGVAGNPWNINNTITSSTGLTISGNFNSAEAASQARALAIQGTGNTTLSGVLQGTGATNGGVGLVINAAPTATVTITGASPNLLSSGGELRSGILILDKAQALGLAATTFDLNGGQLRTSTTVAAQTQANAFRLNGSPGLINGSNPLTMSGSLTNSGGNRILQNDLSGAAQLTIAAISLSNDNTGRILTLTGTGTTNVTGVIGNGGTGAGALTYLGNGSLNLTGANTFTGNAILSGGTTTLSSAGVFGPTGTLAVNQATLTLSNTATQTNNRLGGRALTLSGAILNVLGNASAGGTEGGTPSTLTIGSGGSTINTTNLSGANTLAFTTLTINTGGSINFTGGVGVANNKVTFSTAPTLVPASTGILARATVAGTEFATYGANGIAAFTGYATPTDLNSAAATDTVKLNGTTTVGAFTTNKTVNALAFNASAPTVSNSVGSVLTLTSGGILTAGTGPYAISARTNFGAEGALHVGTGSTLNISGVLSGAAGLNKNLSGALNLNTANFVSGTTTLNGGTTTLAGGLNTIFPGQTLVVNPSATLDLNGNSQYVQAFGGGNTPGTGGTITSSTAALFTNNGNVAYGGSITGAISMNKTGGSTLTAESPLTYTGATWITGGTLTLRDNATLLNTSAININYGTLNLENNTNLQIGIDNRVSDTTAIALRGGTLTYGARFAAQGSETFGALTLVEGASTLNINAANNAGNNAPFLSTDVTFASLTRSAGATVNITANQGFANSGNANRIFFTTAPTTLANGMIGGWAIANTTDFAGYDPTLGVGAIGYGGFRGYDATFASGNITQFINNAVPISTSLSSATTTTSALRLGGVSQNDITFSSGSNVLVLETGGLLRSNQAAGSNIGTTASRGVLTAGTGTAAELAIYSAATGTITSAATATTTINSNVITTVPSTVGLAPGQTITNANFPAGTYIVSIDSPTQITVSQNATASGSANQAIVTGRDNVVVNSVIADNGSGVVTLVKSGAGVLNLSANNTYTGGTIFNQGTVNLIGTGTVIPAGGVTLNGATLALNTNAGQIDATNVITMNDSSTLTLVNNNTLNSLVFNNTGGTGTPTVATGTGTLTLTASTPVTVVSNNVATVPTVSGFVNLGATAKTFDVGAIQIGGQVISSINPALNVSAVMNGAASLTKTGNGILQLSGQSIFTGGVNLTQGGILIGASSSPSTGGNGITGGPLGSGPLAASAGTRLLVDNSRSIANDISFAGTPTFDSTANTAWTLTLNGSLTGAGLASPTPTVQVSNPLLTVALLGKIPNIGTITSFNKTGPGVLVFNSTGYTGDFNATALGNAAQVQLLNDGDGTGLAQTISLGNVVFDSGILPNIIVGRAGGSLPLPTAANKILSPSSISNLGSGITVTNNNGYGLAASDSATLALFGGAAPVISVATASASDVTQGLYLNGALSGIGFTKIGAGTAVLGNASNTFAGNININQGIVSVGGNAQLGNPSNIVQLNPQTGTASLRATGTFTLANPLQLSNTTNTRAIEVTSGNTLTLASAFDLNAGAGATATLLKADQGTLALTASNSGWSGTLTINGGAVSTSLPAALGTGTIVVNETGAALQVSGGITVANPITIDVLANGRNITGINTGGALQSVSGSNTFSGAITVNASPNADNQTRNFGFGANSGATLNLGAINLNHPTGGTNRNVIGYFNTQGTGAINVSGVIDNLNGTPAGNTFLFKLGNGTMTLSAANAIPDTEVRVYRGSLVLNSAATFGTSTVNAQVQAWQNGSITFDNSVTNTANRLTNRVVQIGGGTLNFIPNSAGSSQVSTGALQISQGANVINLAAGGNQTVTFASLTQNGGATLDMTGTFGTANNKLTFATAPTLSPAAGGLLARFTTNSNEFATYNGTTGITTFTGYTLATNVLSAGATQTYRSTSATANSLTGNQTLNALTLQSGPLVGNVPNVGGLLGLNPTTLTLTSGAILANGTGAGTNSSLSVPVVALAGNEGIVHVASGQTLDVSSGFSGTNGFTKSLNGTLNLNQQQFVSGNTIVNGGTLNLQSGATNTLLFNNGLGINTGATVDMKNGVQFIAGLFSANAGGNTDLGGGTLTNSGAQATLVTNSNNSFNGQITGTIYLNKTGTNSLNLQAANTYTGDTFISGGTLNLQDDGTILNTSAIAINYGSLNMSNGALRDNSNRVSDAAPITMTGGTINFGGRAQTNSSETLGAVTLLAGNNSIFADDGNVGVGTGTLTLASIARSVGSTATLRFNNQGDFGLIGSRGRILMTSAPSLTNNLIGPWAIIDREYASYDATYGIGSLNQTGFAGYSGSGLNTSPLATDNVRFTTTGTTTLLANTTVGTLTFGQQGATTVLNLGGNTLTLQGGGLLLGQNTDNVDFSITNGNLTSGVLNSPSDFYLTQANYGGTNRTVTIGAAITDNGTGAVRLIKSGGENNGVTTLSGLNTYTGGTVVNSGTLSLGATGTLGSGGITVNQATLTQVAGGVIPSQALTMNGSSTVTLVGNNTLSGLTIDNNGGSAPTLTPTGILTLTGGTTVTSSNAGAVATLGTGTIDLNGATAYSINVGATLVNSQDVAPWQAGLIINSTIQNGGITKTGAGVLQLGGANTFTSGVTISSGGLIIASDTNSLLLNDPVVTGPVGTGLLTMGANTTMIAGGAARTITNNVTFLGDTVFNGTNNLTLNGTTTLPAIWGATVTAPQMTVTIGDASPSLSSDVINKSGLGLLVVGNYAGTINASGGLLFSADGNTLGTPESINLTGNVNITGDTAITVNRSGGAPNARNKTLQKIDLVNGGSIMSVSNLSGYGLEFTGTTTLNGASHFAVGTATASNVVQGLIFSGVVSDAGGYDLVKSGPGTLVLGNSGNTFGAAGKTIDILGGILSVSSDGALGNSNNSITLNADAGTGVGFRSTGTFSTTRLFNLNQANNAVEVTSGNLLTLSSPLTFSTTTNALFKNDNGILEIAASNSASNWSNTIAGITINAGAVRLSDSAAAGLATNKIIVNQSIGAALQLSGGITVANPLVLNNATNEPTRGGLNSGGNLQSVSGTNIYSGSIATGFDALIGADSGSTLSLTGGIDNTGGRQITFTGAGTINLSSAISLAPFQVNKYGSGILNFTTVQTVAMGASTGAGITMNAGTTSFNLDGKLNVAASGGLNLNPGATLEINDNSASPTNNRLGTSAITFRGGNLNIIGSTSGNTSETLAAPTFARGYSVITVTADAARQANLVFNAAANNPTTAQNSGTAPSGASVLFRGSSLGSAAGAGIATIANSTGGFTFTGQTGAAATKNKGILPWALVDNTTTGNGTSFATADTATGLIRPLAANEYETANTLVANNNILLNSGSTTMNVAAGLNVNSITLASNAGLAISTGQILTLSSGGILARSGTASTISGGVINQINTAAPFNIWTVGDLTISSTLNGGNGQTNAAIGFVKAGAGTLTLAPATSAVTGLSGVGINSMSGQFVINGGTVKLGSGVKNAIQANNFLALNNGTLDLNGNSQQILGLFTDSFVANAGGIITSSSGTGNLVINENSNRNFAGSIQGDVKFTRSGNNTSTLYSDQTYTGSTLINGGAITLRDSAALSGTASVDLNFATLSLDNNAGLNDMTNRLNDSAAITLRGSTLTVQGRVQTASSEALGAVTVDSGFNVINPLVGGTGVNSIDVSLASLSRSVGSAATLIVQGTNLGTIGSNSRVTVGTLNGVTTTNPTYARNGSGLTENLVGAWAINGNDFLSYIPGLGFAPLNQAGAAQYDLTNTFVGGASTDNVRLTATTSVPNGGSLVNAVSMSGSNIALNFATGTDTLNIVSGGLIGPNSNQNIGAALDSGRLTAGGLTPAATSDLYIFNRTNTLTINSRIIDNANGSSSKVRAVLTASGGAITYVNPNASYTGGTVLNGGTLNLSHAAGSVVLPASTVPADGLIINNGTVTMNNSAGQIAAANLVTINGGGTLNYFGDNTQAGIVLNNIGGTGTPTVQSFSTTSATGSGSTGVLTIGSSGVTAASSNVGTTSTLAGRIDFGASANTITVGTINANGVNDIAPLQAALIVHGIVGSAGGITKQGNGVLQLGAQSHFAGPFTVAAGGLKNGVTNAGSRLSALTLNSGTRYDLNNASTTWGSLAGSGEIFSYNGTPTLNVGFDNTSTTFSGQFSRFNAVAPNAVNLVKIGTGVLTLDAAQNITTGSTGSYTVNGGGITFSGAGRPFISLPTATAPTSAVTFNVNNGGTLLLDNSGTSINNRLGLNAAGTMNIQGGKLAINGNSSGNTSETLIALNVLTGGGRIELTPDAATSLGLTITTLNTANGNGSLVVGGIDGSAVGTVNKATLTITTPNLIGGQGTGVNGTTTMGVRHDILGDSSVNGLGTGFLVRDTVGLTYRALASSELASAFALPLTTDVDLVTGGNQAAGTLNVGLSSAATIGVNTVANTLTFSGTSSVSSNLGTPFGVYGPGGNLLTTSLSNAAASLTLAGATATINTAFGSTTAGTTPFVHVIAGGTLNVNGAFAVNGSAGLAKADGGTLNLNSKAYYTGTTSVNNGTLNLNSGSANTIAVVPTAGGATVSRLDLNGTTATVDLKGQNQAVGQIVSVNPLPGFGGTITNSGALALFTNSSQAGSSTFGGQITGAIAFNRIGANTTTLTNSNTYTGATTIRGGQLQLRDSGAISSTAGLTLNYGSLLWDNFGLNASGTPNPVRVQASNPVTMQGGSITINGAGSTDNTATFNTVTVTGGQNSINVTPYVNEGSTVKLTIGNLIRNASNRSGVNFNGFTQNNAGNGVSTLGGQGLSQNGNIIINQLNGAAFSASNLVNNLIGGWAVADGSTFATYVNGFGVSVMGQTTQGIAAPNFTGTDLSAALAATGNYSDGTSRTLTTGNKTANSIRFAGAGGAQTITPVSGTTYSIGVGVIANQNQSATFAAVDSTNTITGTGADLYFYVNQNTVVVNPAIIGSASLVSNGGGTLSLRPQFASNTYSGGTFVQSGTLNLQATSPFIAIPGALTITNAAVTMSTTANQIATSSAVTINGAGTLTLANYGTATSQTLDSITFHNEGGNGNPGLVYGTPTALSTIILSSATPLTSTNNSYATTPTISTSAATFSALQFSNAAPVITVNAGLSETGLNIAVPITSSGGVISKTGNGALALSGASTFTNGFSLDAGSLIFGVSTTGTLPAVTSGPVGTGTLSIAGGTTVLSSNNFNVGNATTVNGDFTFGGLTSLNNLTLSGAMNLGSTGRTITVTSPAVTSTISGAMTSTATGTALTKAGAGTLVLSSATSNLAGAGVAVTGGILKNGVDNAIPAASAIAVSAGAGYDLSNFNQTVDGISGAGFITNSGASTKTLTVSSAVTNSTFDGVLTDNILGNAASRLALTKAGSSNLTLSGNNTYTGGTAINGTAGSVLTVNSAGALGTTGSISFGGGTLQYTANNTTDYSNRFSTAANQAISIDTNNQNVTLATALTSSGGSLSKQGAGTLTVTAANTYTAGTTVNGGTLLVNNSTGSGTGSGAVSVSNAGTVLGGNGTVAGNLTVNAGALIAPGSAASTAGTLTIGGSTVVIAGNGVAETRVNFDYTNATGNVPGLTAATWSTYSGALLTGNGGQSNDLLNFTATTTSLSWNTGGKINLNQIGSAYSWIQGDVFNLLDWTALGDSGNGAGAIGGTFNSAIDFNLPTLSGGLAWDTSRFVTTGAIAVIPEPSRALLMLFGLMALFFRRRRQD